MSKDIIIEEQLVKPLSVAEQKKKEQLEGVIVANFKAFVTVGQALAEIRDRQLYRVDFPTFERYCNEIFDVARGTAYRYIAAAEVVENVSNWRQKNDNEIIDVIPINEAQVRPLTKLRPEQQIAVWQAALESAPNGRMTASHVNNVVKKYLGEKVEKSIRKAQAKVRQAHVSAEFADAFEVFAEQILKEKQAGYKLTSRAEIIEHLDQLRAEIAEDGEFIEEPAFHGGANDTMKLLRAGYRLFRTDRSNMTIKEHGGTGWKKHSGPFDTIKAMEAEFKTILQDDKHLRG
ncbi:MAG: hypothetical protein OEY01_16490 [Desulfobulbaceae bacterium]|nr:hypothetical protein [Desulfobulbaceae bacterium]